MVIVAAKSASATFCTGTATPMLLQLRPLLNDPEGVAQGAPPDCKAFPMLPA